MKINITIFPDVRNKSFGCIIGLQMWIEFIFRDFQVCNLFIKLKLYLLSRDARSVWLFFCQIIFGPILFSIEDPVVILAGRSVF